MNFDRLSVNSETMEFFKLVAVDDGHQIPYESQVEPFGNSSLLPVTDITEEVLDFDLDVLDSTGTASSSGCQDSIKHVQHEPVPDQLKLETENSISNPLAIGNKQLQEKSPASTPCADIVTIRTRDTYHPTTEEFLKAQDSFQFANDGFVYDVNEQCTYENPVFNFETMEFDWPIVSTPKTPAIQIPVVGGDRQEEPMPSQIQAGNLQAQERHEQGLKNYPSRVNSSWSYTYPNPNQLQPQQLQTLEREGHGLKNYSNGVNSSWSYSYPNSSQHQAQHLQSQERERHGLKNFSAGVNSGWSNINQTFSPVNEYAPLLGPHDPLLSKPTVYSKEVELLGVEHYDNYIKSVDLMAQLRKRNEQIAQNQRLRLQAGDISPMNIDAMLSPIRFASESYGVDNSVAAAKNEDELGVKGDSSVNCQIKYRNGVANEPQSQSVASSKQLEFRDMKESEVVVEEKSQDFKGLAKPKGKRKYTRNQSQGLGPKKAKAKTQKKPK